MPYAVCRTPYAQFAHPPCAPPYAVLPFVMRCMPCCRTSYAIRRTLHAYCRARVSPYAVRNTRSAVLPHYRTAVRRAAVPPHGHVPYCRTAALPYAALLYYSCPTWGRIITIKHGGIPVGGRGTPRRTPYAVLPYCRTPYCRTAVLPYAVLPYAVCRTAVWSMETLRRLWSPGPQITNSEKATLILLHMTPASENPQVLRSQASS